MFKMFSAHSEAASTVFKCGFTLCDKNKRRNAATLRKRGSEVYLRGHVFGRLYSDGRVPLSRGQHRHLVQELVDARHQVVAVFGFVGDVVENLLARAENTARFRRHLVAKVWSLKSRSCPPAPEQPVNYVGLQAPTWTPLPLSSFFSLFTSKIWNTVRQTGLSNIYSLIIKFFCILNYFVSIFVYKYYKHI